MADILEGKRVLITSGPTRAPLDEVRYISNRSTGELGLHIVHAFLEGGASVIHVCGVGGGCLPDGPGARYMCYQVETVADLIEDVEEVLQDAPCAAIIHAMAVLDFEPVEVRPGKTSSAESEWVVRLRPTPKVIDRMRALAPDALLIGFKLEVGVTEAELVRTARDMAQRCGADLVVANDLHTVESGRHVALLVTPEGRVIDRVLGKPKIAQALLEFVENRLAQ